MLRILGWKNASSFYSFIAKYFSVYLSKLYAFKVLDMKDVENKKSI